MEIKKYIKGKILVQIDAANLESSVKDLGWHIDYQKLRAFFDNGRLVQIRHYCVHHGTENQNNFFVFLKHAGFVLITKPLKVIKDEDIERGDIRKANFDVEISLDTAEMLSDFGTLVLFSGDSDFHYLIKFLKKKGKKVIVISSRYHVSRELVESADKYIDLKSIRKEIERKK